MFLKNKMFEITSLVLIFTIAITSAFIFIDKVEDDVILPTNNSSNLVSSELISNDEFIPQFGTYVKYIPKSIRAVKIFPGIDFTVDLTILIVTFTSTSL